MRAFVPNPALGKQLEKAPAYKAALVAATEPALAAAKSMAPVDQGDYRAGLKIQADASGVRLVSTFWTGHWIEFGSAHNPPSAPIRRGVRAAGLKFKESPKL